MQSFILFTEKNNKLIVVYTVCPRIDFPIGREGHKCFNSVSKKLIYAKLSR